MLTHIFPSGLVGNSLKAECPEEPIEDRWCVVLLNGLPQPGTPDFVVDVIEEGEGTCKFTDGSDEQHGAFSQIARLARCDRQRSGDLLSVSKTRAWLQIRDTSLRCASLSPSMYLCVVWIER